MKKLALATVTVIASLATSVYASDVDLEYSVSVKKDSFSYKIGVDEDGISELHIGSEWFKKELGGRNRLSIYSAIEHEFGDYERTKIVNDIKYTKTFENWNGFYAIANIDYDITNKNLVVGPTFGGFITINDKASVYADMSSSFLANEGFEYIGSEIGAGVSYNIHSNIWLTGGFTRNVDTDWDEKNSYYINTTFVF